MAERADAERLATAFHRMFAEIFAAYALRKHQLVGEIGGNQHRMAEHLAQRFEPGCRVHRISEIGDLVVIDTDFCRDDRPAMDGETQAWHFAEAGEPHVAFFLHGRLDVEHAAHAGRPPDRHVIGPGDDGGIANVIVDDAAMSSHWCGIAGKDFAEEFLGLQIAMGFGEGGGADEIDEDEDAVR